MVNHMESEMNHPDGPEAREAERLEAAPYSHNDDANRADEAPEFVLDATATGLVTSAVKLQLQRDALADTLRDLALGATMMLEPVMGATGAFEKFAKEVQRVARAGLKGALL